MLCYTYIAYIILRYPRCIGGTLFSFLPACPIKRHWINYIGWIYLPVLLHSAASKVQLKCDDTRWRTGGEVKGKLAYGVDNQYPSHYLGTWCIQHYYRRCAQLACQQSTTDDPRRFKWTRPFRRKTKSGFCACAITFQTQSTKTPRTSRQIPCEVFRVTLDMCLASNYRM
jgi:hypothetical protein